MSKENKALVGEIQSFSMFIALGRSDILKNFKHWMQPLFCVIFILLILFPLILTHDFLILIDRKYDKFYKVIKYPFRYLCFRHKTTKS